MAAGPASPSRRPAQRGFTMVELVAVMLIMGIVAALAMPRLTDRRLLQERGVRDQLRGMLLASRQLALTQEREVCVLLLPASARVVYAPGGACSPGANVAGPGGATQWRLDAPAGVVLSGPAQLRFNARGQPMPAVEAVVMVGSLSLALSHETGLAQ